MNAMKFSAALGNVRDDYVSEAIAYQGKRKRHSWLKWGAMAACLCLIAGIVIPVINHKGNLGPVQNISALGYNGRFYEAVDIPEVLEKYGLPSEITPDMAGEHLSYLKSDGGTGYECTPFETDIELYQYAPAVCEGVYVLRNGGTWRAALFCNFYQFDSNTNQELTELYRVYGIESADDIAAIAEVDWLENDLIGKPVTDRREIADFYDMTISFCSYGNEDFQEITFGDVSDEDAQAAHTAFADDRRGLRIETTDGLRFFLSFFPNYDWIRSGGTMSYYRIDDQMHNWIDKNLN